MEGNRILRRVLYINLGTRRLKGRPRNRWQDEVRETSWWKKGWKERMYNRQEWKELLRMARNCSILHIPVE
jgi:hypothetical protein